MVAHRREVAIPEPDGLERVWAPGAYQLVDLAGQRVARLTRGDGDRHDHPGHPPAPQGLHGCPHRRPGGQPVVDQDHCHADEVAGRSIAAIDLLLKLERRQLARRHPLDLLLAQPGCPYDLWIEHAYPARGDRAHGELLLPGHAELAHQEHLQRDAERPRYLVGHRHAPAGQAEHDDIGAARILDQAFGQPPAGVGPVCEALIHRHEQYGPR